VIEGHQDHDRASHCIDSLDSALARKTPLLRDSSGTRYGIFYGIHRLTRPIVLILLRGVCSETGRFHKPQREH